MPYRFLKNSLVRVHYGRWTEQDEFEFYQKTSTWKGSCGLIPQNTPNKAPSTEAKSTEQKASQRVANDKPSEDPKTP